MDDLMNASLTMRHSSPPALALDEPSAGVRVGSALAALTIVTIPLGPLLITVGTRALPVYWSQIAFAALCFHLIFSSLAARARRAAAPPMRVGLALSLITLMGVGLISPRDELAAVLAYANFSTAVLGGVLVGRLWAYDRAERFGTIDKAWYIFVLTAAAQLLSSFGNAQSFTELHQNSVTPWGESNFVAGVIVVASLLVLARLADTASPWILGIPIVCACAVALATLSRGALLAAGVGVATYLWALGRRPFSKFALRVTALAVPIVLLMALNGVTSIRSQVNSQVFANIDARWRLYETALGEFRASPIIGTGWASLRQVSETGQSTFAHNVVFSFLQIGGLGGLAFLCIVAVFSIVAIRRFPRLASPILGALAVSMTDPFLESYVAGLLFWAIIWLGASRIVRLDAEAVPVEPPTRLHGNAAGRS